MRWTDEESRMLVQDLRDNGENFKKIALSQSYQGRKADDIRKHVRHLQHTGKLIKSSNTWQLVQEHRNLCRNCRRSTPGKCNCGHPCSQCEKKGIACTYDNEDKGLVINYSYTDDDPTPDQDRQCVTCKRTGRKCTGGPPCMQCVRGQVGKKGTHSEYICTIKFAKMVISADLRGFFEDSTGKIQRVEGYQSQRTPHRMQPKRRHVAIEGLDEELGLDEDDMDGGPPNPQPATQSAKKFKQHPSASESQQCYTWLANIQDANQRPPNHLEYDPRTIYIPPSAWDEFCPADRQYWEIKQKFWDTIVFIHVANFYHLCGKDADIGHQIFGLKFNNYPHFAKLKTVSVPKNTVYMLTTRFVAKGYKVAVVDQMESALAGKKRTRYNIRREVAAVLTPGTLVDTDMLQDDMPTYCMAIKMTDRDNFPGFGVAIVDTATAQFQLCEFIDGIDMLKFETLIAQMRIGELLIEKSCISARALKILRNNTSPRTVWNFLKSEEFWPAEITIREIEASGYFKSSTEENIKAWPHVLREARERELVMSAFGALLQYLRLLKIERELISLGNFAWYDPIQKATSLVLDRQSLTNLELFTNTFDGSGNGTLFAMLNRCITPFGKRLLKQWVYHPLDDAKKINARLDAVDALKANSTITDQITSSLSKLPDLERLISRVHAGRCKAQDFLKVLEGFEQIEYTISLLKQFGEGEGEGEGVIGQLIAAMADLAGLLEKWKEAFDRDAAKSDGILIPGAGVEEDYDNSQEVIDNYIENLEKLLKKARKDLGSNAICFRDKGKVIYQLEVPKEIKIPSNWDQMSATVEVTRYYSPELRKLVRALQEAQEAHSQITREVHTRFCARVLTKIMLFG